MSSSSINRNASANAVVAVAGSPVAVATIASAMSSDERA